MFPAANFHQCGAGKLNNSDQPTVTDAEPCAAAKVLNKVLLVDDEADLADLASLLLSTHGLEVVTVYSAMEALRQLEQDQHIDAVVSDIVMPGMNGLQLGDAIREMYPQVKVVLVSGYAPPKEFDGRERSYLFATKPYRIETLLRLLHS